MRKSKQFAVSPVLERACYDIADMLNPGGYSAVGSGASCLADLKADKALGDGMLVVSALHSDRTIFSSPEGNYAFRAWHEQRHLSENAEFDRQGELMVHSAMRRDLEQYFRNTGKDYGYIENHRAYALLECENIGQLDYWARYGSPPDDQRTFALGWLAAKGLI